MVEKIRLSCGWLLLFLVIHGCDPPQRERLTFRYHFPAAPSTLDPAGPVDTYSAGIIDRLFDGLMQLDRLRNVPVLELADSSTISPDGLTYKFRLAGNVRFHNGRRIKAADFKYSWERLLDPEIDSPSAWLFDLVEGVGAYRAGEADSVAGIIAEDSGILRIHLREPFAPFLYHLANSAASVVPREEVERLRNDFGRRPVGSGPYRFMGRQGNTRVVLAAFADHHRFRPEVTDLIYEIIPDENEALRRYQAGELDLVSQLPSGSLRSIRQSLGTDLRTFPGSAWYGFCFRCDQKPFDDPRVRRAFSLAIDRDLLVSELGELQYIASVGFLPRAIPGHDPATLTRGYDPERARKLMAEAGYPMGRDFPEQTYITRSGAIDAQVAHFLVTTLSNFDLDINYKAMGFDSIIAALRGGQLIFFRHAWSGEYPDPDPYLRPMFHSLGSDQTPNFKSPEVDHLLDAARTERDGARRLDLYRRAEQLIRHDAPCVVLYHQTEAILLQPRWTGIPIGHHPAHLEIELAESMKEDS